MYRVRLVAFLAFMAMVLSACGLPSAPRANPCDDPSYEPLRGAALADAVRERLNLEGEPTCADLEQLTTLDATGRGVRDLLGLEHATALVSLRLDDNDVSELRPITRLSSLRFLYLAGNPLRDLTPLGNLDDLFVLSLHGVEAIPNLEPLRRMTRLEHAYLSGTGASDGTPLAGLARLRILHLESNQLDDVSFLSGLTQLRDLRLAGNRITDVSALVDNPGLAAGARVDLRSNCLDLTPGSASRGEIDQLLDRGVDLVFDPQRDDC